MKILIAGLICVYLGPVTFGQPAAKMEPVKTGPEVGQLIPQFTAPDQHGVSRTAASIPGPKGALLVFFRSADW